LALALPAGASAVTVEWHTVEPCHKGIQHCPWFPDESTFAPRLEVKGNAQTLEATLARQLYGKIAEAAAARGEVTTLGQEANTSLPDYGWEASDGWWCRAGEVYGPGIIYTIPNPRSIPSGWWGAPQCRSMTIGPEGAHWFTDPGTESVGRVDTNGAVTEYPLPEVPTAAEGYERDPYPTPAAISTVGSELWVASSSGEGMYSVCVACEPMRATTAKRHHHRRHRR
jgi:hypothetical protein